MEQGRSRVFEQGESPFGGSWDTDIEGVRGGETNINTNAQKPETNRAGQIVENDSGRAWGDPRRGSEYSTLGNKKKETSPTTKASYETVCDIKAA